MTAPDSPGRRAKPPVSSSVIFLSAGAAAIAIYAFRSGSLAVRDAYFLAALIPSIIVHEVAHGVVAGWFGDKTAANAGRITLNPLRHVDILGTILIPGALILSGSGIAFGYAKPVPVNTTRMTPNQALWVGLGGPGVNVIIAIAAALFLNMVRPDAALGGAAWFVTFALSLGVANVVLAAFNLIPIPPLDGASVIERFLPSRYMAGYLRFRKYSVLILLAVMLLLPNRALALIFEPAIELWGRLLT